MGTVVRLKMASDRQAASYVDALSSTPRSVMRRMRHGHTRWTPDDAARAWWEMTMLKSTLEALCDLSQQALHETSYDGWPPRQDLKNAFAELKAAADKVGAVCHAEVQSLLLGDTESLAFACGADDPKHITVTSEVSSISLITPSYRQIHLGNPEMARLAVQVLEGAVTRFADAITCLSMTVGAEGPRVTCGEAAQFARDTAALTRLQILAQADKALCSQAGAIPARVYSLLNHPC